VSSGGVYAIEFAVGLSYAIVLAAVRSAFDVHCSPFKVIEMLVHLCVSLHRESTFLVESLTVHCTYAFDLHIKVLIYSARNCSPGTGTAHCKMLENTKTRNSILQLQKLTR
jgi:hypothetical protein